MGGKPEEERGAPKQQGAGKGKTKERGKCGKGGGGKKKRRRIEEFPRLTEGGVVKKKKYRGGSEGEPKTLWRKQGGQIPIKA